MTRPVWVVLGLAVAGCGGGQGDRESRTREPANAGGATPATASVTGACTFISEADASAALEQPSRYRNTQAGVESCILEPSSGDVFHGTTVEYRLTRGSTAQYDFIAAQQPSLPVMGLGDRALWLSAGDTRGNLVVVAGSTVVNLIITDFDHRGDIQKRARAFAKRVVDHL